MVIEAANHETIFTTDPQKYEATLHDFFAKIEAQRAHALSAEVPSLQTMP